MFCSKAAGEDFFPGRTGAFWREEHRPARPPGLHLQRLGRWVWVLAPPAQGWEASGQGAGKGRVAGPRAARGGAGLTGARKFWEERPSREKGSEKLPCGFSRAPLWKATVKTQVGSSRLLWLDARFLGKRLHQGGRTEDTGGNRSLNSCRFLRRSSGIAELNGASPPPGPGKDRISTTTGCPTSSAVQET